MEGIEGAHIYDGQNEEEVQKQALEEEELKKQKEAAQQKKGKLQKKEKLNAKNVKRELTGHVVTRWYRVMA